MSKVATRQGTVKWFSEAKGYGFITPDDGGTDVFVHFTGIEENGPARRNLSEKDLVSFEVGKGPRGLQATNVRKIG